MPLVNPVRKNYKLRLPRPLPKHLRDEQVTTLFDGIDDARDRAMFMLMLRCGLRVEEVSQLTADAIEYRRRQLYVFNGKGSKDRVLTGVRVDPLWVLVGVERVTHPIFIQLPETKDLLTHCSGSKLDADGGSRFNADL